MITKEHFDLLLLTTCDMGGGRSEDLDRLLKSVEQARTRDNIKIQHYLLLQRCPIDFQTELYGPSVKVYTIDNRVSLSKARNILLSHVLSDNALDSTKLVAFPDDDAWYPSGIIKFISDKFFNNPLSTVDIFVCRYSSTPRDAVSLEKIPLNLSSTTGSYISCASSNTIFLKASLLKEVGYFDERLGVGAEINGGEDLDYALRAFIASSGKVFTTFLPLVGHRDRMKWVRSRYFSGSFFALVKSSNRNFGIFIQMLRKILVGVFFVINGEMKPKEFFMALRLAFDKAWKKVEG